MKKLSRELIDRVIDAFLEKDIEAVLSHFHEDGVLLDPHYPNPEMHGKQAIRAGLTWGYGNLVKPGFKIVNCWIDGDKAAIEVDTHHIFKGGMEVRFLQVFIIETHDEKIDRIQSFVPYPPPGIGGWITKITRMAWKLKGLGGFV